MLKSIRIRLILSHLMVIILVMGLSGFLLLSFLQNYFLRSMEDGLIAQAHITTQVFIPGAIAQAPAPDTVAETAQYDVNAYGMQNGMTAQNNLFIYNQVNAVQSGQTEAVAGTQNGFFGENVDLTFLEDASLQMGAQLNTRIRILDRQGQIVVDSYGTASRSLLQADSLAVKALDGQYASRTEFYEEQEIMSVAVPAFVEDRLVGVIYLSQPLASVTIVLDALRTRWLISTAIAVILAGLAALLLSQAITRPLHHLTHLVNNLSREFIDGPSLPLPATKSWDEIGQLQRAFDEMAKRLKTAQQMQIDFVANVSHELRTPLTSVKGIVETLQNGAVDDLKVRDRFLDTMAQETDRLIRLVKDLLLLSRADSDALQLQNQRIDVASLVQATLNQVRPQAFERELTLVQETNETLHIQADRDRITQVLLNLLDNALKYSRAQTTITVSVGRYSPDTILIAVKDEGMGIAAAHLSHIGQRFYRTDKARSRGEGGSGLGLAIARALVEAHWGKLWIESEEGVGTAVFFTLPGQAAAR